MKMLIAITSMIIFSSLAIGGGDKVNNPRLIVGEDGCVYTMPSSTDNCDLVPAPPQSGIQVYVCAESLVICIPDEDPRHGNQPKG